MKRPHAELLQRLQVLAASADPELGQSSNGPAGEAIVPASQRGPAASGAQADLPRTRALRVDMETLDRILDLTGEIAVGRAQLTEALEHGARGPAGAAAEIHREADRLHAELQELVMKARMEPLGPIFRRFSRTVRDLAADLGKSARLVIEGEDVEVDAKVAEHVRDPLTHLVRNALAHGLETPGERARQGKDPHGLIRLRARRETGGIVIEVHDDGAGLSLEHIARRARERGLLSDANALTEAELQRLIFEPGFSTAASVTEVSGRGVGLDVVRRNVEALHGSVSVDSRVGQGTTFSIRLPLSLAIIPGFAVRAGQETYILPLEAVIECLELPKDAAGERQASVVLNVRDEPLPCRFLRQRFALGTAPSPRQQVVVVQHDGQRLGLVVDELLGETQTVLKPLSRLFGGLAGLAGSAILGSGRVALVLDLPGLFREAA